MLASALVFPRSAADPANELSDAFKTVLMDAALPVVLAPDKSSNLSTVIIAWDGSAEAARAVRFHLDLIKAHERVIIAQNPDDISQYKSGAHSDPEQLKSWMAARQLPSEIRTFDGKIAKGLTDLAAETQADMIVAGAYGHSRIGEFLFGGATRSLLQIERGPALALSH